MVGASSFHFPLSHCRMLPSSHSDFHHRCPDADPATPPPRRHQQQPQTTFAARRPCPLPTEPTAPVAAAGEKEHASCPLRSRKKEKPECRSSPLQSSALGPLCRLPKPACASSPSRPSSTPAGSPALSGGQHVERWPAEWSGAWGGEGGATATTKKKKKTGRD